MRQMGILALALAIGTVAGCGGPADGTPEATDEPPAVDGPKTPTAEDKNVPPALAELMKERAKLHQRQTGALLTIQATSGWQTGAEASVQINWEIDYTGPRHPFTIFSPTLSDGGHTTLHGWYVGADGKPVPLQCTAAKYISGISPLKQKESFSVAAGGKPVAGSPIIISWRGLSRVAGRAFQPGETVLLQLEHAPTDRGDSDPRSEDRWTVDAWTGQLWSQPVPLTVVPTFPPR